MSQPISIETDTAAAEAHAWRTYAQELEEYGKNHPMPIDELHAAVGDRYGTYVAAKSHEYAAREAAYARAAAEARAHADKLDRTRQTFQGTDDDSADRIRNVLNEASTRQINAIVGDDGV